MEASELQTEAGVPHSQNPSPAPDQQRPSDSTVKESDGSESTGLSRDDMFGMLSNPRRRATIHYLNDHADELVELRDLAEQLAAWENEVRIEAVTYKQRKRVYTSLYQSHLPKMDELGIVEFNKSRGTVAATTWTHALHDYLDDLEETEQRQISLASLTAVGAGIGLLVAALAGAVSIGVDSSLGLGIGVTFGVLTMTTLHAFVG